MYFEWSTEKAARNLAKHGVPFHEATEVWGSFDFCDSREAAIHGDTRYESLDRTDQARVVTDEPPDRDALLLLRTIRASVKVYFDVPLELPENETLWRNGS